VRASRGNWSLGNSGFASETNCSELPLALTDFSRTGRTQKSSDSLLTISRPLTTDPHGRIIGPIRGGPHEVCSAAPHCS